MVANDGLIRYDHNALNAAVQEMFNINAQITQEMEQLKQQVKQNQDQYLGASSERYGIAAGQIDQDLQESTETLQRLTLSLQTGSDDFQGQDRKLADLF
ncbi:WXG100 family type VII secretion target [Amycolatopsis sp. NPDC049868]|uniref:WXG100 family type VII secretion target n=1 Tax=Amycolatopsis sp. NPDC049868 TaxID=3363934 RepID=UPI0037A3C4C1